MLVLRVLAILPQTWQTNIGPDPPQQRRRRAVHTVQSDTRLSPWTGFAVFCLYAALALIAAAILLGRRDT